MADGLLEGPGADDGPGGLFHSGRFAAMHPHPRSAFLRAEREGRTVASVHFADIGDGVWRSPARGTFAGWAWDASISVEELGAFIDAVTDRLAGCGASRLEVLLPPMGHDPAAYATAIYLLHSRGWVTSRQDLNSHLDVDTRPLPERMSRGNVKRLRQCERAGLVAGPLSPDVLPAVHEVLVTNRSAAGRELSMSLDQLTDLQRAFPDRLLLFGVRDASTLVAAAVCLQLDDDVVYVYAWGHLPSYAVLSPVVSLAREVYACCQRAGIRLLDLGTSTIGAETNPGLLRFKRGLGATESLKTRLVRDLGPAPTRTAPHPEDLS